MIERYVKPEGFQWKAWMTKHWKLVVAGVIAGYLGFLLKANMQSQKEPDAYLKGILNSVIIICSVMPAILLAYVIPRIIQTRQEKLHFLKEYKDLSQQVHYFRAAIYPLYKTQGFWRGGLLQYLQTNYADISIYDVNKITFVSSTPMLAKARAFINDGQVGGMGNFYMKLKAFFPWGHFIDEVVYSDSDTDIYYPHEVIELWHNFHLANTLYYYLDHEYINYQDQIFFNAISNPDRTSSIAAAKKVKKDLAHTGFGPEMFSEISSYVESKVLPRLYELGFHMKPGLGKLMKTIINHTVLILFFGLIFPFMLIHISMHSYLAIASVCIVLYIFLALVFTMYDLLFHEGDIDLPVYRKDVI